MNMPDKSRRSACPITYTIDIIGDRWAMLIIRDIILTEKSYFGDFANSEEGIATNVLTNRLKRLEDQGIISKEQDKIKLSKYIYRLTDMGLDLLPIMIEMILFACKHDQQQPAALKDFLAKIKRNKNEFIKNLRKKQKRQLHRQ